MWVPAWQALERRVFDALTVHTAPGELKQPIALIGITDEAIREMKLEWPWPRWLHGELVNRIAQGGAAVIALDIVFDTPAPRIPRTIALFARGDREGRATSSSPPTSASRRTRSSSSGRWSSPSRRCSRPGALAGRATIAFDVDQFVRRIPTEPDAFWRQIIKVLQVKAPSVPVPPLPDAGALIRYMGPDTIFDPIPYHLVLQASPEDLKTAFEGRIVIVGRELRAAPELGLASSDLFATPFLGYSGTLTAGMKVHATIVDNALSGTSVRALGFAGNLAAVARSRRSSRSCRCAAGARSSRPRRSSAIAALFGAASGYLFARESLWIATATPVAVAVLAYLAYGARAYLGEQRRKREVQRAFSRYVSPELVAQIVADPRRLALGGEKREITVLFTDLAGFTKLTEKLGAARRAADPHPALHRDDRGDPRAQGHGGAVHRRRGDGVLGRAARRPRPRRCTRCEAAIEMQARDGAPARGAAHAGPARRSTCASA